MNVPDTTPEIKDLKVPKRGGMVVGATVWIDWDMRKQLDLIAVYEHTKRSPLMRNILVEKVRCYERNPSFKSFLKRLREQQLNEKKSRKEETQ